MRPGCTLCSLINYPHYSLLVILVLLSMNFVFLCLLIDSRYLLLCVSSTCTVLIYVALCDDIWWIWCNGVCLGYIWALVDLRLYKVWSMLKVLVVSGLNYSPFWVAHLQRTCRNFLQRMVCFGVVYEMWRRGGGSRCCWLCIKLWRVLLNSSGFR